VASTSNTSAVVMTVSLSRATRALYTMSEVCSQHC
jgi:hypothetical protein